MYSLPAKVVEVDEATKKVKVMFRDESVASASIISERKVVVGTYVSITGRLNAFETCGATFTPADEW